MKAVEDRELLAELRNKKREEMSKYRKKKKAEEQAKSQKAAQSCVESGRVNSGKVVRKKLNERKGLKEFYDRKKNKVKDQKLAAVKRTQIWRMRIKLRERDSRKEEITSDSCNQTKEIEQTVQNGTEPESNACINEPEASIIGTNIADSNKDQTHIVENRDIEQSEVSTVDTDPDSQGVENAGNKSEIEININNQDGQEDEDITGPFPNRMAEHRAFKRARQNLPSTPAKRACLVEKLATSPGCSKYLQETVIATPDVKELASYGITLVASIKSLVDTTKTAAGEGGKQQAKKALVAVLGTEDIKGKKRKLEKKDWGPVQEK